MKRTNTQTTDWMIAFTMAIAVILFIEIFNLKFYHTTITDTSLTRTDTTPEVGAIAAIVLSHIYLVYSGVFDDDRA